MIKTLHRNGVPSAFARDLTPALAIDGSRGVVGRWSGVLDRSSSEHPHLAGSLTVILEMDPGGRIGTLVFEDGGCAEKLLLRKASVTTLSYTQSRACAAAGDLQVRPAGGRLMLSLLPLDSDVLVLGTLSAD
jgi:hypothetical protein